MRTINEKSTKTVILAAYNEALERVKVLEAMTISPKKEAEKMKISNDEKKAESIVERGILNAELTEEYNSLISTIELKKKELKELYDIDATAESLASLVNAKKLLSEKLDEEHKEKVEELNERINELKTEINNLESELINAKNDYVKSLNTFKMRTKEEYDYETKRERQKDNDAWEDEKAAREKELKYREIEVEERLSEIIERENTMDELEEKIAQFPEELEEAIKTAKAEGKAEAEKSHVFETRALKKDAEYERQLNESKISSLTEALEKAEEKNSILEAKLENAYEQIRTIATETVKSSGGVKILNSDSQK